MSSKESKKKKGKDQNGEIILPIRDGEPRFSEIRCDNIELSDVQMLYLLALAYSYLELQQKGKAVISNEPIPNITEQA